MTHSTMYLSNSHTIRVDLLRDEDGNYINDAAVTLESLLDKSGNEVTGVATPLSLTYVASSNGRYEAALGASLDITRGRWYDATVKAVSGSTQGQWVERVRAAVRRA